MASPDSSPSTTESPTARAPENPGSVLAVHAVNAMAEKKAHDITVIDLRDVSSMADFFVIGSGDSDLQVRAIARGVTDRIEDECGEQPWKTEGTDHLRWVVLDYVDVVVHVFLPSRREHYRIERLWGEADSETISTDGDASEIDFLEELHRSPDDE
ncbi:MAG: ribosome silencing factor [Salinibacter sp.]